MYAFALCGSYMTKDNHTVSSDDGTLEIVGRVLESDPKDRATAARALCRGNTEQLNRVMRLVELEDAARDFLERPLIASDPHAAAAPGRRIDRYTLVRLVGAGGSAMVYEAIQDGTGQRAALKTLHPAFMTRSSIRRLEFEAEALGRLKHPGIAHVYAFGSFTGQDGEACPYIALEFVEGTDILTYCERNALSIDARLRLVQRVCDAVEHAHQRGVIHRDLKPPNILVDPNGQPKILDFGIARAIERDESQTQHTRTGDVLGTIQYMSPEQMFGDEDGTTTRSDVYSLGILAYRLVTGKFPYPARSTILGAADMLRSAAPIRPRVSDPRVPRDLETILLKAIDKDAARRYPTSDDLRLDLERYLTRRPIEARRPTQLDRMFKFFARNWRQLVATAVVCVVTLAASSMVYIGMAQRLVAMKVQTEMLSLKDLEQQQRLQAANMLTAMISRYLRLSSDDGAGANWLHILSFIDSLIGFRTPGLTDTEELWKNRVRIAQQVIASAKARGRGGDIEPLMIESSLCLWLLRTGNGKEALSHLDAIEPRWRAMLDPKDEWFTYLSIFRKCGELLTVNPEAPNAATQRRELYMAAVEQSNSLGPASRPVTLLLEKLGPIAGVPAPVSQP